MSTCAYIFLLHVRLLLDPNYSVRLYIKFDVFWLIQSALNSILILQVIWFFTYSKLPSL